MSHHDPLEDLCVYNEGAISAILCSHSVVALPPCPHLSHGSDLTVVGSVGRGLSVVLTSLPSCKPAVHSWCRHHTRHSSWTPTPTTPTTSTISLRQPKPSRYRISPLHALPSDPVAALPPLPFALSFERAANFWPLLLERVGFL